MRKKYLVFAVCLTFGFLMLGCSTVPGTKAPLSTMPNRTQSGNNTINQVSPTAIPKSSQTNLANPEGQNALLGQEKEIFQRVYFNVNSAAITNINQWGIRQSPQEVLDKIAHFMIEHPTLKIKIEGNCDDRGTDSYNLALGQQRADAAKNYLVLKGVSAENIDTISNGKFKPIDSQNNEYAWAKNRNDDFVIVSQ